MKLYEAIENANIIRPNSIDDNRKAAWIFELECDFAEMMEVDTPENSYDLEHPDIELLMPEPKARCYELYLAAMIDHENQDMDMYNADLTLANASIDDARAWWRRNHRIKDRRNWRVM